MQRVARAAVSVDDRVVSTIGPGLCLLVGVDELDSQDDVIAAAGKIAGLRIFSDDDGKMNLSVSDARGEILVVSQFTLLGDVRRGRRPSFTRAAPPDVAERLMERMTTALREMGISTASGVFGAKMSVEIVNDGPVTLVVDVRDGQIG